MALRARALYDFNAENPGEISISENEFLTLHSEEVVEGWLDGVNSRGETGLFPASYVEILNSHLDANISKNNNGTSGDGYYGNHSTSSHESHPVGVPKTSTPTHSAYPAHHQRHSYQTSQGSDDDWDDDWDDSSTVADEPSANKNKDGQINTSPRSHQQKGSATVGRNLNRFSTFVKSGGEAFLLGEASGFVKDGDKIFVVMGDCGPEWQNNPYPFSCSIDDPTKQTKFKGMKSYMSYKLTPSHTQSQVQRRYKHFDWLYARLVEKFPVISVPHLPEKQATGRFEEDFISKRRKGLIWWMNHMASHPVLSQCDVFQHFLTCSSNDEKAWKQGKRKAEKDDLVGANFFLTISTPAVPLDLQDVESKVEVFKAFTKKMDENLIQVNVTINEFARKQTTGFKKEYQRVGQSFRLLSQAFEMDQQPYSVPLNKAIAFTGEVYEAIGDYFADQPRHDIDPISDLLAIYQGHLTNFPDIIHVQKGWRVFLSLTKKTEII